MIYFVAPDFDSFISGGNVFNKQIFSALEDIGRTVRQVEYPFHQSFKANQDDVLIFDSIFLNLFDLEQVKGLSCKKYFLCHLLPSMIGQGKGVEYEKKVLQYFDRIIVNSFFCKDLLRHMGLVIEVSVITPFIDIPSNFTFSRNNTGAVVIANWLPTKQLDKLLACLVKEKKLPLSISIIGATEMDLPYFESCNTIISKSEIVYKNVKVLGRMSRNETWGILSQSEVLLDCSAFETYGMAVAEAASAGLPVLTLGNGNIKNIVHPESICGSIETLVERFSYKNWTTPAKDIVTKPITDWNVFLNQFKELD